MEEGEEPTFTYAEETKRQIRREERKKKKTEEFEKAKANYKPSEDPEAIGDPYKTLFIARLNKNATENDLRREFESYGNIERVRVVRDKNGRSRGYAFIVFERERDMKGNTTAAFPTLTHPASACVFALAFPTVCTSWASAYSSTWNVVAPSEDGSHVASVVAWAAGPSPNRLCSPPRPAGVVSGVVSAVATVVAASVEVVEEASVVDEEVDSAVVTGSVALETTSAEVVDVAVSVADTGAC
ncbi:hypothetical protein NUW54_g6659 [Trametes sanguinea]|uniref:Uncharacterized protein n=1 Tax=Trametes sanguinea TaxID=158606 RepID=A0ACC1PRM6_9APHY|nr:hypothetical protein NUW54_g6659 [Trametes sanguinea]